jgi:hypothetical protein
MVSVQAVHAQPALPVVQLVRVVHVQPALQVQVSPVQPVPQVQALPAQVAALQVRAASTVRVARQVAARLVDAVTHPVLPVHSVRAALAASPRPVSPSARSAKSTKHVPMLLASVVH